MKIDPFLMFQGRAEEAMRFYVHLFGGEILELVHHGSGTVMKGALSIAGQTILCTDSTVEHAFTFTPASSLFVTCDSEAELDRLAAALADGGKTNMPLGSYGFSRRFAWIDDRFGVSWQLNLP